MRRFIIVLFATFLVAALGAVSVTQAYTLEELTADDGPKTDIGWVDDIDLALGLLVIGDFRYRLGKDTFYLTENSETSRKENFKAEMTVRYLAEDDKILALWHVHDPEGEHRPGYGEEENQKPKRDIQPSVSDPAGLEGEISKDDGVWTN